MTSSGPQDELFRKMCGQTTTSVLDEGPEKEGPKSPQAVEPEFQLYSHVKLVNLQNRPEMNDHIGVVRSTKNASGRFGVSLLRTKQWKSKGLPGDPIAIKAQNLEAVAPFDTLSLGAIKKIYGAKSEQFWNPRGYDYIRKCGRFPGASTVRAALCETAEQQAKAWDDSEEGQYWRRVGAQGSTDHARGERYQVGVHGVGIMGEKVGALASRPRSVPQYPRPQGQWDRDRSIWIVVRPEFQSQTHQFLGRRFVDHAKIQYETATSHDLHDHIIQMSSAPANNMTLSYPRRPHFATITISPRKSGRRCYAPAVVKPSTRTSAISHGRMLRVSPRWPWSAESWGLFSVPTRSREKCFLRVRTWASWMATSWAGQSRKQDYTRWAYTLH